MRAFLHIMLVTGLSMIGTASFVQAQSPSAARQNSLGMKFLPVPGTSISMNIWETRVSDFSRFVDDTGHDATTRFYYYQDTSWRQDTNYWRYPGHEQGPDYPVTGISWRDAQAFCRWLTQQERQKGLISSGQHYRLPTEAEWDAAASGTPNPAELINAANYHPNLNGDPYEFTSPVGSFPPNPNGFYDMAGNVWEYCLDASGLREDFRVIRGGCWQNWHSRYVGVHARGQCSIDVRITLYGFRIVLDDNGARDD